MATHVQGTGSTSATAALTGVTAGNLIVAFVAWTTLGTTITQISDGTSNLTALTRVDEGVDSADHGQMFYLLSANGGDRTYTITFSGTSDSVVFWVAEFNSSGAWSYDASNGASGISTAPNSGNISTTGTDEIAVWGNKLFNVAATLSNPLINGVTPTEPAYSPVDTYHHLYYRLLSSTFTDGAGAGTYSVSTQWVSLIAAFKAAAGGAVPHNPLRFPFFGPLGGPL